MDESQQHQTEHPTSPGPASMASRAIYEDARASVEEIWKAGVSRSTPIRTSSPGLLAQNDLPCEAIDIARARECVRQQEDAALGISEALYRAAMPDRDMAVAAVTLGTTLIERDFTLSRPDGGPHAAFPLELNELKAMIEACRDAWAALGRVTCGLKDSEFGNLKFRRSLYATADIMASDTFTTENVHSMRPGHGLPPKHLSDIIGKPVATDISCGTRVSWSLLDRGES